MHTQEEFAKIKEFTATLWLQALNYRATGRFTNEEFKEFLDTYRDPEKDDYVLFKKIPENLTKDVRFHHAYHVFETRPGESNLLIKRHENKLRCWVKNEYLKVCPDDGKIARNG